MATRIHPSFTAALDAGLVLHVAKRSDPGHYTARDSGRPRTAVLDFTVQKKWRRMVAELIQRDCNSHYCLFSAAKADAGEGFGLHVARAATFSALDHRLKGVEPVATNTR